MESDSFPAAGGLTGINLANYFPSERSFNTVVYTHKRFLNNPEDNEKLAACTSNANIIKSKSKERNSDKHDKAQQFIGITKNEQMYHQKEPDNTKSKNDSILNQTIRFAKNLVPLVIPPEESSTPVFYTIEAKKSKRKDNKICNGNVGKDTTYNKAKSKRLTEYYRNERIIHDAESSIKDSISQSSQNTLNEINLNESLSCTISDLSIKKKHKREKRGIKNCNCDNQKFAISNSFEALAAETVDTSDGSKIKIHLMNETDKNIFRKSLQVPIIKAIKECISELHYYDSNINSELKVVQRLIKCNNEKLDLIMDKVACMENRLNNPKEALKTVKYSKPRTDKTSKLEQLSEDLVQEKKENSTESESRDESAREIRKFRDKRVMIALDRNEKRKENQINNDWACGDEIPVPLDVDTSSVAHLGVKVDRPIRIPTRFCWTEASSNG